MFKNTFLAAIALASFALPATAVCQGSDLIQSLPDARRAALERRAKAAPFARGLFWQAQKNDRTISILGTYHLEDPRHGATLNTVAPRIETADLVMLESTPDEMAKIQQEMATDASMLFIVDGPTLHEQLNDTEWQRLKTELGALGVPGFLATKFKPSYAAMMLQIPPCAFDITKGQPKGLDMIIADHAIAHDRPLFGLDEPGILHKLFEESGTTLEIDYLRSTLNQPNTAADQNYTMTEYYFSGDMALIWEFARDAAINTPGMDRDAMETNFAELEQLLLAGRNADWVAKIQARPETNLFMAVGAAHLPGDNGVLKLLENAGYAITALPLE